MLFSFSEYANTTGEYSQRNASPVHRLGLTHGKGGIPKLIRENSEQFFATATGRNTRESSTPKPVIFHGIQNSQQKSQQQQRQQQQRPPERTISHATKEDRKLILRTPTSTPTESAVKLPPIRAASNKRSNNLLSASVCAHQMSIPSPVPSVGTSLESIITTTKFPLKKKRPSRKSGPIDPDIFRRAYERALSVARSRLLFRDPYSLTRATSTTGILYSYYDHTPMCVFSRGSDCNHNHNKNKTSKDDQHLKPNSLRKKIFNDVIVENYI